jgi:hypothetical protein
MSKIEKNLMIGKKTNNNLQPGLVWVPYIPIQTVEVISEKDFNTRLSLKSRYTTKVVNSAMYGTIGNGVFYTQVFCTPNQRRIKKIEKIFKIKNPTE